MTHHLSRRRKAAVVLIIIIGLLVIIRLALPYVVLHYANDTLANMDGYRGHIEDIDLAIIRGAYKVDSFYLNKVDTVSGKETPFLGASAVDLAVEWRALFKGSIVGKVLVDKPLVRFTKDKVEPKDVRKDSSDFRQVLDKFMPLKINRLELKNGTLQYIDEHSHPKVNVKMTNVDVVALNLKNSYDSAAILPATITARATVYDGTLDMKMKLNPLAEAPTFDLNAEWRNTNLVKLNDFFQAYAKVDVNKGTFGLYTEVAAKDGAFTGYVKPLLKNIDVLGKEDRKDNVLRKMWEGVSEVVTEVFENQSKKTVATKIPFRGRIDNPKANIWQAIVQVLQNAFVHALQPAIDQQINLAAVDPVVNKVARKEKKKKGFLQKLFGKKGDRKRDRKNKG
jgi:hypothetical protein